MVLYNDTRFITNSSFPDTDFMGNADFVIPDNSDLAAKIIALAPNFEIVTDDSGNIIDAVGTEPVPLPQEPTDHERLEALEAAFMEFVSEVI